MRRPFSSAGGGGGSGGFPLDDVLGAPTSRGAADPDFAVFGDDCLLKFRLSTYVAPGAAGMYKSNNVRCVYLCVCLLLPVRRLIRLLYLLVQPTMQARLLLEFTRKNAGGVYDWRSTKVSPSSIR